MRFRAISTKAGSLSCNAIRAIRGRPSRNGILARLGRSAFQAGGLLLPGTAGSFLGLRLKSRHLVMWRIKFYDRAATPSLRERPLILDNVYFPNLPQRA